MLALPQLMEPRTAPGPGGLALPAVQAYVPDYLPGAVKTGSKSTTAAQPPSANPPTSDSAAGVDDGSTELAAQFTAEGSGEGGPGVALIPAATRPRSRAGGSARTEARPPRPAPPAAPVDPVPAVLAATPIAPLLVAAAPSPAPAGQPGDPSRKV